MKPIFFLHAVAALRLSGRCGRTVALAGALLALPLSAQTGGSCLAENIAELVAPCRAQVGVAVIMGRDTVCVGNDARYPMMSLMKLPLGVWVTDSLLQHGHSWRDTVSVAPTDLRPDTYSPLRQQYPHGGRFSLEQLMRYALQLSDNNACDWLLAHSGGPAAVERFLRRRGLTDMRVQFTESDMHAVPQRAWGNWTTPLEMARLLAMLLEPNRLTGEKGQQWLRNMLLQCQTGQNRLARPLQGTGAVIGHKTGTSDRDAQGRLTAMTDAGFVCLPDGRTYVIAVLVREAAESDARVEQLMADVSELVYRTVVTRGGIR